MASVSVPRRRTTRGDVKDIRGFIAALPPFDDQSLDERRRSYDRAKDLFLLPEDVTVDSVELGLVRAERIGVLGRRAARTIVYLHGGAYVMGSPDSHRHLAAAVARAAEATVLLPRYRLAPEHPFPAALDDVLAVYRALLEAGHSPESIVIAGDSAGGGLAVATMMAARDEGLPLPAAAALVAPWVDLSCTQRSVVVFADKDPLIKPAYARESARQYLAGRDPRTPLASPLYGDLHGLPPLLIQVAAEEVLHDDSLELHRRALAHGVRATLEIVPDMIHVWHWFAPILREGREAIARMGAFIGALAH